MDIHQDIVMDIHQVLQKLKRYMKIPKVMALLGMLNQ